MRHGCGIALEPFRNSQTGEEMDTRRLGGILGERAHEPTDRLVGGGPIERALACRDERLRNRTRSARCQLAQLGGNRLGR